MDEIDMKLIELLQLNSRMSITELSETINLSRPSVSERIAKLVECGVFEKFTAYIPPQSIGRNVVFYFQISELKVSLEKIEALLLASENVLEIHAVTGAANYIVKAATENIEKMNVFLAELMPHGRVITNLILNSPLSHRPIKPVL